MVETLSQSEIDALLSALNMPEAGQAPSPASPAMEGPSPRASPEAGGTPKPKKGKVYDFKRQTKFSKEQLRTIQLIHESFSRLLGTYLATQLRAYAQANIYSVDQITFEEFIQSIYSPTFLMGFHSEKLDGKGLVDLNLNVVFAIIDRLLGGTGTPLDTLRQLTEIENQVMQRIMSHMLSLLREAWINVTDLMPRIDFIESNPQFAQIVPPTDMVLAVGIEIKIQEVTGMMNLCIPYNTVESIAIKLNAASWFAAIRKEPLTTNLEAITGQVRIVALPIVAELGTASITLRDIINLQIGDILVTDRLIKEDLDIRIGSRIKFKGRPGIVGKKMAISISQVFEQPDEELLSD
ncbi:flagellar motor switch protein FliM [bacterium]|nr:flagellar motor switch protein FliM [bacterium]